MCLVKHSPEKVVRSFSLLVLTILSLLSCRLALSAEWFHLTRGHLIFMSYSHGIHNSSSNPGPNVLQALCRSANDHHISAVWTNLHGKPIVCCEGQHDCDLVFEAQSPGYEEMAILVMLKRCAYNVRIRCEVPS